MQTNTISVKLWQDMLAGGYRNLKQNMSVIDELNVFPVPDGDTGKNMTMTIEGGVSATQGDFDGIGALMTKFSRNSLLSARGNSGVILSQFIRGLAIGSESVNEFTPQTFTTAYECGVKYAYNAVAKPTEGTMLTVLREGGEFLTKQNFENFKDCFDALIEELHRSLRNTPELLPVLKEAGVVDSGGAGIICIFEGMQAVLNGESIDDIDIPVDSSFVDTSNFNEDSTLEYGYCTEFILQLLNCKTDIAAFRLEEMTAKLEQLGDSVVTVQDGSIVKIHVHSFSPEEVIRYVRRYGELVNVKIENMSVQHSEIEAAAAKHEKFAVIATATGDGIMEFFKGIGVSEVINGGRTNNPSADDFIQAFNKVNADYIIVLPNDSNVVLTAEQAAKLYDKSDVRVIKTRSIAEGFSALSMMDLSVDTIDELISDMTQCLPYVASGYVTTATRDALFSGVNIKKDDWIGLEGDTIYAATNNPIDAAMLLFERLPDIDEKQVITAFYGKGVTEDEVNKLEKLFSEKYPLIELGFIKGDQDVYRYIFAIE